MKTITLEVYANKNEYAKIPNYIKTLKEFKTWFQAYLDREHDNYQCIIDFYIQGEVMNFLNSNENIEARNGITGGCYGARDGKSHEGLTVYIDACLLPERWLDEDGDEIVNIEVLLNEYAHELEVDPDQTRELLEALGHESKRDNTYNYLGQSEYDPHPLSHADFEAYSTKDDYGANVVIVKFHCGGDIRGNYSSEKVYKFTDSEDFYRVFSPDGQLKTEDNN